MTKIFSIKSAAVLCVAAVAMCFGAQEASAQRCGYGGGGFSPGFGGSGFSINYSSGYRGIGGFNQGIYGGYGRGLSIDVGRPVYARPVYYGNSGFGHYPARNVYRNPYGHSRGRGHGHRHW